MSAEPVPDWMLMRPPGGWTADDLDLLPPEAPRCEVLDGVLIVMSPQRSFHATVMWKLTAALSEALPPGWRVEPEMTIRIDKYNRPEPDLVVVYPGVDVDRDRTSYLSEQLALVVEIQSPDSIERDRVIKPKKYARAKIPNYWLVDDVRGKSTGHVFELNARGNRYTEAAVERFKLEVEQPFPFSLDLGRLYP